MRQLSMWMQGALTLVGVVLVPETRAEPGVLAPLVASLVLLPGPRPSVRVGLGVGLLLFCFPLHPGAIALLLALGFLTHHTPGALWAFFRTPPDASLRPVTVVGALALCGWSLLLRAPTPGAITLLAGVLLVGAFLLSRRWMLTASVLVLAGASLGKTAEHGFLEWRPEAALAFAAVALGAALLSALCQVGSIQRALTGLAGAPVAGAPRHVERAAVDGGRSHHGRARAGAPGGPGAGGVAAPGGPARRPRLAGVDGVARAGDGQRGRGAAGGSARRGGASARGRPRW